MSVKSGSRPLVRLHGISVQPNRNLCREATMKGITPCLWFDHQAEEAAEFYASVFRHSKVGTIARYGEAGAAASGQPAGSVMTVEFEIAGQKFLGLNGGP